MPRTAADVPAASAALVAALTTSAGTSVPFSIPVAGDLMPLLYHLKDERKMSVAHLFLTRSDIFSLKPASPVRPRAS
jgi:hypothetical protein